MSLLQTKTTMWNSLGFWFILFKLQSYTLTYSELEKNKMYLCYLSLKQSPIRSGSGIQFDEPFLLIDKFDKTKMTVLLKTGIIIADVEIHGNNTIFKECI